MSVSVTAWQGQRVASNILTVLLTTYPGALADQHLEYRRASTREYWLDSTLAYWQISTRKRRLSPAACINLDAAESGSVQRGHCGGGEACSCRHSQNVQKCRPGMHWKGVSLLECRRAYVREPCEVACMHKLPRTPSDAR
jgi:hypothetical protein